MDGSVSWLLEVKVKPGEIGAFKTLIEEMVDTTRREPGTLAYEFSVNDDDTTVHVHERYADSAATLEHVKIFGENFAERFVSACQPQSFIVYGTPSQDVKDALAGFAPVFMSPLSGFAR
jgi:quinol monooxygenase YgiN